jgi:outer membrane protein assembly factor BamB
MNSRRIYLITKVSPLIALLFMLGCNRSPGVLWHFKTGAGLSHPPAISGEKLIVGSEDYFLYALDLSTGNVLWKTYLGERVLVTPLAEQNRIYTGTAAGDFFGIDANNGKILWKFHTGGMLEYDPCSDEQGIYFGSYDGKLYKINRQGQLLWAFATPFYMSSSCAFYKDLVITSSWDHYVYGISRVNGKEVWKFDTGEYSYGAPIVVGNSGYYVSHDHFYGFHPDTGKLFFQGKIGYAAHVMAYRNELFIPENGLTKRSLDGKITKNLSFKPYSQFCPAIAGSFVVMADTDDSLIGASPDTLEIKWKFHGKDLFACPGVEHKGIYYIGNTDGNVYALRLP